jgi:F-type H+-transporting ATPase subunit b
LFRLAAAAGTVLLGASTALASEAEGGISAGDLGQAIASLIIFALLLWVLGHWAWKPIITQLRRREEGIGEALSRSEQREKEAQELLASYRKRMEAAEGEVLELVNQGRKEAAEVREQVVAAARDEAHRTIESARSEIDAAKNVALRELESTTAGLATDLSGQIIGRTLGGEDHQRLVQQSLETIRRGRSGGAPS